MSGAVWVAIASTIGNFLQGWDNATIAGAVLYIKNEFDLDSDPKMEGLLLAMSLIGSTIITTCSGPVSDWLGRRIMMIISSVCFFVSALVMLWSPNIYVLLLARLVDGFGGGLAVTLVPLYISETAPTETRGLLNTVPQFAVSSGMFISYCMVFGMSLTAAPSWRLMLGVLLVPSILYFALAVFYLPESPRWLVSKGRMAEARTVLQQLRGVEDVSAELALLVEGLDVGTDASIEEFIIEPDTGFTDDHESNVKDEIKLYGSEEGQGWVARPVTGRSMLGVPSRQASIQNPNVSLVDPLVTLFGSVHEKLPDQGSVRTAIFPTFGSMFSTGGRDTKDEEWEDDNVPGNDDDDDDYAHDDDEGSDEDNLRRPLMFRQTTSMGKPASAGGTMMSIKPGSMLGGEGGDIGGGWQLAWQWTENDVDGHKEGGFKRIYLHQEAESDSKRGSIISVPGGAATGENESFKAAALVSQPALYPHKLDQHVIGPARVHPSQAARKGASWRDLLEPGVRHALVVGVGIQFLEQFSGISGVLSYTPQILQQAGVSDLVSNIGIGPQSASLLLSGLLTLLMLPSIAIAMRLMDISGRRTLLLTTIPPLVLSLILLILVSVIETSANIHAVVSTLALVLYFCFFMMAFAPVPNILCAEIFPTRVRGVCIAICALTFWISDIIVTDTLPLLLKSVGLAGVFGVYAVFAVIAWFFIFLKVPETKGMPLEVITEFFALGAKRDPSVIN